MHRRRRSISHKLVTSMTSDVGLSDHLTIVRLVLLLVWLLLWIPWRRNVMLLRGACPWLPSWHWLTIVRGWLTILGLRILLIRHWWTSLVVHLRRITLRLVLNNLGLWLSVTILNLSIFANEYSLLPLIEFLLVSELIDIDGSTRHVLDKSISFFIKLS